MFLIFLVFQFSYNFFLLPSYIFHFFVVSLTVLIHSSLEFSKHLYYFTLVGRLLMSILFCSFSEFFLLLLFFWLGQILFISSFYLVLCLFYVLGKSAISSSLKKWTYLRGMSYEVLWGCPGFSCLSQWHPLTFLCGGSLHLIFRSSPKGIIPYAVANLLCLWEEVNSGSSYTTIFNPPQAAHWFYKLMIAHGKRKVILNTCWLHFLLVVFTHQHDLSSVYINCE